MTAAFPWHDLPSVRWANDILWKATGPGGALDRDTPPHAQWRSEDLVVSQACGLDLFLGDAPIEPVLAPAFELDCEAGRYYLTPHGRPDTPAGSIRPIRRQPPDVNRLRAATASRSRDPRTARAAYAPTRRTTAGSP